MSRQVKITQVRSEIGALDNQQRTLEALGLRGVHKSVVKAYGPALEGMIKKVAHLVKVEDVK